MPTYSSDAPLTDPSEDRFKRWPFAQRVAGVLSSRTDTASIVVGIYGAWGEGKTSVLNMIQKELERYPNVVCFKFNPWRFGLEEDLLKSFFLDLAASVDRELNTGQEKVADAIRKYGGPLGKVLGRDNAADSVADALGTPDLLQLKERLDGILIDSRKRVVVLMDDIDRLDKDEIHAVFRLVKLTGDFRNTAYVLAFDEDMVSAALQDRYANGSMQAGRSFLEKIVQIPLHLPPPDPRSLRQYCYEGVDRALDEAGIELTQDQVNEFVSVFSKAFANRLETPRMAVRYGNALAFALPILKGEVNPVDLLLVEGMRVFFPALYSEVKRSPDVFLGSACSPALMKQAEVMR
jgi:predicted KAP-like P-loop ATPase